MQIGNADSDWTDHPAISPQAQAQPSLPATEKLVIEPAPVSAEHQLREYLREMSQGRYGHASALLTQHYGKSD